MTEEVKTEPAKARPWQWPAEWFRDEKFWREVTARGLSGLIVVFIAYWAAVLFGILQTPTAVLMASQARHGTCDFNCVVEVDQ